MVAIAPGFGQHQRDARLPVLLVEGTKQLLAAASVLSGDDPIAVPFGVAGCWGWSSDEKPGDDLGYMALHGRDVVLAFDADVFTNYWVYRAAARLQDHLRSEFLCRSVSVLQIPSGGKDGLDDLLGRVDPSMRLEVLGRLIREAVPLPKAPPRKPRKGGSEFFDDSGGLRPQTLWAYLEQEHHLAMAGDNSIAVFYGGVYHNGKSRRFTRLLADLLADHYRPEHLKTVIEFGLSILKTEGKVIPFKQDRPLINMKNGLLNLERGKLHPHDPSFLSGVQFPFEWDPKATCPTFDRWLDEQLPGQGGVLLDVASQMLDQTRQPTKFLFLIGPSRTGKSTFLRLLQQIAGPERCSSVSLHSLSTERFAPARLFGKVLNTFADLSADELSDLSILKALTGGDTIHAEYKCVDGFDLQNMALLAFSANTVPLTSEASQAYLSRASVFRFDRTFLGTEDPSIEAAMFRELPGIFRRLVEALIERRKRGRFLEGDQSVQQDFARRSDRVRAYLAERTVPCDRWAACLAQSALFEDYRRWMEADGTASRGMLGKHKFNDRVRAAGVPEGKTGVQRWGLRLLLPGEAAECEGSAVPDLGQLGQFSPYSFQVLREEKNAHNLGEWTETAQTAQKLDPWGAVEAKPCAECNGQAHPLHPQATNTEHVAASLAALRLAPEPSAAEAVWEWLKKKGTPVARAAVVIALERLQEFEAEEEPQLGLAVI
ncbi:DUF3854 domain-containing protein [Synechococcus sp. Tobar12-5m-g]|nr:DUF3854 domain-containing protein [Synechococcus sp. Tobar12-5m-g]MCP9872598.1 DUF3854 domain-containing protein [Synechococcus sp. Cruz CV-v-12]